MPRVSVIIPTYNCGQYLERAISSVDSQTYRDFEIVVADDGSTDNTREILERLDQPFLYAYQENGGLSSARNLAVSRSCGEFLAYLDADDAWYPSRLAAGVAFLESHPNCGLVHSEVSIIDDADKVLYPKYRKENRHPVLAGHCIRELLGSSTISVPTVLERRSCFDEIGGFDERLRSAEDYLHWVQVTLNGWELGYIEEPLAFYRWREGSLTKDNFKMIKAVIDVYTILLREGRINDRVGSDMEKEVRESLYSLRCWLIYKYRCAGNAADARSILLPLMRDYPGRPMLWLELLKNFIPTSVQNYFRKP